LSSQRPRRPFLFPVKALSTVFRAKFIAALERARRSGQLRYRGQSAAVDSAAPWKSLIAVLRSKPCVVYSGHPIPINPHSKTEATVVSGSVQRGLSAIRLQPPHYLARRHVEPDGGKTLYRCTALPTASCASILSLLTRMTHPDSHGMTQGPRRGWL
jgi:hypothetical protein